MKLVPTCQFICVPQQHDFLWNLICRFGRWFPGCRVVRSRRWQPLTETPKSGMKLLLSHQIISMYTSQKGAGILTKVGAGRPMEHGSTPRRVKRYVQPALGSTLSPIQSVYGLSVGGKVAEA
jgi:hypothetical protein